MFNVAFCGGAGFLPGALLYLLFFTNTPAYGGINTDMKKHLKSYITYCVKQTKSGKYLLPRSTKETIYKQGKINLNSVFYLFIHLTRLLNHFKHN